MMENRLFEALLDVIPFAAYAVDIETYEVVYANKLMTENMHNTKEEYCWKKIFGQDEICSWCTIHELKQRTIIYNSEKLITTFFNESTDKWLQNYDELVKWPDGRTVRYSIAVDITEQKEIQANMIKTHTKLAIQSKKLQEANKKLEYMATKDFLTGINNRGYFFKLFQNLLKTKLENDYKIFVAMLDLDKFKNINDTYGHNTGDEVLKIFTQIVIKNITSEDIFGRLGGEEFAIVIKSTKEEFVIRKLEKIRTIVENTIISTNDVELSFTVSIGIVQYKNSYSIDMALDEADKKLYEAKNDGRNKIKFRT